MRFLLIPLKKFAKIKMYYIYNTNKIRQKGINMGEKTKRGKKIRTKMLGTILPVLIIGMVILTAISVVSSRSIIKSELQKQMNLQLNSKNSEIVTQIEAAVNMGKHMAAFVGLTYQTTDMQSYISFLEKSIYEEDCIYGSGIWFEPNQYDAAERYVGPYVYKDGGSPVLTNEYSNADYDYFVQEYYTATVDKDKDFVYYSQPYYDETLDVTMISMSMPIYNNGNQYLGCITVDITTDTIRQITDDLQVGDSGTAFLLSEDGTYLAYEDNSKIMNAKMTEDENDSIAKAGVKMLSDEDSNNTEIIQKGETYYLYYKEVPNVNWKMGITIKASELNQKTLMLGFELAAVALIILLLVTVTILIQVQAVSKQINRVKNFAGQLANGNFTIKQLSTKRSDELGAMGASLNEMYRNNKQIISKIANDAGVLSDSGNQLHKSSGELKQQFDTIEELMNHVTSDMTGSSAATEEVNASVEEMNSSVTILAEETERSLSLSNEIKKRAAEIENNSTNSYRQATELSSKHQADLQESIKNAEVVRSIGELADAISGIADQINLLSLNASIEAARAGEQGKGFAVVASEIGKLAGDTSQTVNKIQDTIGDVQNAFDLLVKQSQSMLLFMTDTVAPDYDAFVNVSKKYGEDANAIEKFSNDIAEMASNIEKIIQEVSLAIQNISESSLNTVGNSNEILTAVETVSSVVGDIRKMSKSQEEIAYELSEVVGNFVLEGKTEND